jgi:hypothetical protein
MADPNATTTTGGIAGTVDGLVGKTPGWIDQIFAFFGLYTSKYSKYIVYIIGILALAKIFKVRLNLDTGKGRK